MARKANPIGPHVLALIEDARVDLVRAVLAVREGVDVALSPQRRRRSVKLRAWRHVRDRSQGSIFGDFYGTRPGQNLP